MNGAPTPVLVNQRDAVRRYPDILFLTLDSCRWDTFVAAGMLRTCAGVEVQRCFAQATFTYPAHLALLQGILPHSPLPLPFYNRYRRQLIRIARRASDASPWLSLPPSGGDIVGGLRSIGYRAQCWAATEWFEHENLVRPFDALERTGTHAARQLDLAVQSLRHSGGEPAFLLVNFGETHHPYGTRSDGPVPAEPFPRSQLAGKGFWSEAWERQVAGCSYLDAIIGDLLDEIRGRGEPALVVVCADHGECFGEDDQYGHGFYHPKVMEIPMVIHFLNGASPLGHPAQLGDPPTREES